MTEQNQNGDVPMMPEPTPVYDVTYQHIYAGQVFKQFYVFLWISVAMIVGAILPWNGEFGSQGFTIWQVFMLVCGVACVVNFWNCIKGRRLTLWPILALEMLGIFFVLIHYSDVQSQTEIMRSQHLAVVQREMDAVPANMPATYRTQLSEDLNNKWNGVDAAYDDGVGGAFLSVFGFGSKYINSNVETRAKAETQMGMFGIGYHITWIGLAFVMLFMIGSTVFAIVTAKPKEDPGEARRRARQSLGGKKDGEGEDEAKS